MWLTARVAGYKPLATVSRCQRRRCQSTKSTFEDLFWTEVKKRAELGPNTPKKGSPFIGPSFRTDVKPLEKSKQASSPPLRVAVKDNIATIDATTTAASGILKSHKSPYDASIIEWLKATVDISMMRKTNMDEFGMGSHSQHSYFGPVLQKKDLSPGGSSGGSALAVARDWADLGIGTDTGGSVRLPASYTGVVGFKPSYGVISRYGVIPYANSLDTVGFMTKDVETLQSVYGPAIMYSHSDNRDPTCMSRSSRRRFQQAVEQQSGVEPGGDRRLKTLRIGVPTEYNVAELSNAVKSAWQGILCRLEDIGHKIVPISLPSTKHALSAYYVLAAAEASSNLAKYDGIRYGSRIDGGDVSDDGDVLYSNTRGQGFGEEVKRRILLGSYTLSSAAIDNHFIQAQKVRRLIQRDFDRVFATPNPLKEEEHFDLCDFEETTEMESKLGPAQIDVIICPTAPNMPPEAASLQGADPVIDYTTDVFTVPASLAGLPAISIPIPVIGHTAQQTTGIQIIGQYWDDQLVLSTAALVEAKAKDMKL